MKLLSFIDHFNYENKNFKLLFCLVAALLMAEPAVASSHSGKLKIAVTNVQVDEMVEENVKENELLVYVIDEALIRAIYTSFEDEYSHQRGLVDVQVKRTKLERKWQENQLENAWSHFQEMEVDIGILSRLVMAPQGSLVRVVALDLREERQSYSGTAFMGNDTDFEQIETKLHDVSQQLAKSARYRVTDEGVRVLLWCLFPKDRDEVDLIDASIKLTLGLPYSLTALAGQRDINYEFVGLTTRDYYYQCASNSAQIKGDTNVYLEYQQYDFIISGEIAKLSRKNLMMYIHVDSPRSNFITPLQAIEFSKKIEPDVMDSVATDLLDRLTGIADGPLQRGLVRPSPPTINR